jgi:O-antigen ligase
VIVSVGAASAAYGIIQYGVLHYDNLGRRPEGALTHYMTYSGILMLVLCAAVARLVFGSRDRTWPALVMPALIVALALTFTRSAWVGAAAGVGLLFVLKDFRLTALLPVVVLVTFAIAPQAVTNRMTSMFNAQDPANQDRLAMVEVGARMIAQHPLTGVGPNMVPRVYEEYRPDYAVNPGQSASAQRAAADRRRAWCAGAAGLAVVHRRPDAVDVPSVSTTPRTASFLQPRSRRLRRCLPPGSSSTTSATRSS